AYDKSTRPQPNHQAYTKPVDNSQRPLQSTPKAAPKQKKNCSKSTHDEPKMASNPPTSQSLPPPRQTPSSASSSSTTTTTPPYQAHLAKLIRSEIASLNSRIATLERRQESITTLRERIASEKFACGWVDVLMGRGDGEVGSEDDDEDGNDVGQGGEAGEANGKDCEQEGEGDGGLADVRKRDSHGTGEEGAGAQGRRALKSASAVDVGMGSTDTESEMAAETEEEARRDRAGSFSEGITGEKKEKERRGIWRSRWRVRK
ncbi:hypothetical protein BS50DRAFT_276031, partial [Corynespora cassiicola Philippines]